MAIRLTHARAVWLMVAAALMWSTAGVVSRQLESAARFEVTFWRSAFTGLALLVILPLWRRGFTAPDHAHRRVADACSSGGWRKALTQYWGILPHSRSFWLSGVCWSVMFTAFMLALTFTSVANVLVIMSVGPLFTALVARVFIGHRLALRTWLAIVVAGTGMAYMFGAQLMNGDPVAGTGTTSLLLGSLIALCVPVAGAINWTVVQRSQSHGDRIDLVPSVLVGALLSSALTLPLAMPFAATPGDIAWLAWLGLFQLAIPCTLSVMCARVLKAPEISLLALLEVIFGIFWAWMWANEVPGSEVMLGGSLVIGALVTNEWLSWRDRAGAPRIQTLNADTVEEHRP